MAAMALNSIPFLANAWENGASFSTPLIHHREARPHPHLIPEGKGVSRASVRFPQSVAHRERDGPAGWVERSEAQHSRPLSSTAGSAPD